MFAIHVKSGVSQSCFQVSSVPPAQVWHSRYGYLSYSGLKTLMEHDMEDAAWDWGEAKTSITLDTGELNPLEESSQEDDEIIQNSNDTTATTSDATPNSTSNMLDSNISRASENSAQGRTRRPPIWMRDYVTGDDLTEEDAMNFAMFACSDPVTYTQASKI
ncbi:hypothetical protein KIW84_063890 [Lathyrus oleraceus]|uniref:Uncharacterized protein n=1 Tax=Pisum sativum TaxID=3888 RepID=A0A9D4WB86_PEA|nr:hypothetical protein KIW84_063890 [Pisum sativum]